MISLEGKGRDELAADILHLSEKLRRAKAKTPADANAIQNLQMSLYAATAQLQQVNGELKAAQQKVFDSTIVERYKRFPPEEKQDVMCKVCKRVDQLHVCSDISKIPEPDAHDRFNTRYDSRDYTCMVCTLTAGGVL